MRYMVNGKVPVDAGNKIEETGGPSAIVGYLMERHKPEATYYSPVRREFWWVVDFPDQTAITEFMLFCSTRLGCYPEFSPCISGAEFPDVIAKVLPELDKAPNLGD